MANFSDSLNLLPNELAPSLHNLLVGDCDDEPNRFGPNKQWLGQELIEDINDFVVDIFETRDVCINQIQFLVCFEVGNKSLRSMSVVPDFKFAIQNEFFLFFLDNNCVVFDFLLEFA